MSNTRLKTQTRLKKQMIPEFRFHPVTPERLRDLARFSEQHGKFRYRSCMRWRLTSTEYKLDEGKPNSCTGRLGALRSPPWRACVFE